MGTDQYFSDEKKKLVDYLSLNKSIKTKHITNIDIIPERYKRRDYIIDKFNNKKKNVD